jgi:1-deoxy-D-xylulose-5-phosphate synthase
MVNASLKAVNLVRDIGVKPQVVNARFIKPLDEAMLREILNGFNIVLTVEEGALP